LSRWLSSLWRPRFTLGVAVSASVPSNGDGNRDRNLDTDVPQMGWQVIFLPRVKIIFRHAPSDFRQS
jgi:hypothetical protein